MSPVLAVHRAAPHQAVPHPAAPHQAVPHPAAPHPAVPAEVRAEPAPPALLRGSVESSAEGPCHDAATRRVLDGSRNSRACRVLHVSAELAPWAATGGLADVTAALPRALRAEGVDARILLPGYPALLKAAGVMTPVLHFPAGATLPRLGEVRVGRVVLGEIPVYLIECASLYERPGTPYGPAAGGDWPDNDRRFALLAWVAARLTDEESGWVPQIIHAHDWHAGLVGLYLRSRSGSPPGLHAPRSPRIVITVHNIAYQGLFDRSRTSALALPERFIDEGLLEYYGQIGFLKAGLACADEVITVSPTHARELLTDALGCGLQGVLRVRQHLPVGILNGVDPAVWSPATDPGIAARYDAAHLDGKARCRGALQAELGLDPGRAGPLIAVVSRLAEQKGLDLLLPVLPRLLRRGASFALLGAGDPALELAFVRLAAENPGSVAVRLGHDDGLAHRIIAGADLLVMPSRYEPCGLTQMYALAYGTLPVVRHTGGLADTVRESGPWANGFVFENPAAHDLAAALGRAIAAWTDPPRRRHLQQAGMSRVPDWGSAARSHAALYARVLARSVSA